MSLGLREHTCANLLQSTDTTFEDAIVLVNSCEQVSFKGRPISKEPEYRACLADTKHSIDVMFGDQPGSLVEKNKIDKGTLLEVKEVTRGTLMDTRIVLIQKARVVGKMGKLPMFKPIPLSLSTTAVQADSSRPALLSPSTSDSDLVEDSGASSGINRPSTRAYGGLTETAPTPTSRLLDLPSHSLTTDDNNSSGQDNTSQSQGNTSQTNATAPVLPTQSGQTKAGGASQKTTASTSAASKPKTSSASAHKRTGSGYIADPDWDEGDMNTMMLSNLRPKMPVNWQVFVRIHSIFGPRTWSNDKGSGTYMFFIVEDEMENAMKVLLFNEKLIQVAVENLKEGDVMKLCNAKIRHVDEDFRQPNLLEHEAVVNMSSQFEIEESNHNLPPLRVAYTDLRTIQSLAPKSVVNILAILHHVGGIAEMKKMKRVAKNDDDAVRESDDDEAETISNGKRVRRELTLVDTTKLAIRVAVWNAKAQGFKGKVGDVISLKNVVVATHGGVSLNVYRNTTMSFNPAVDAADELKKWYDELPEGPFFQSVSSGFSAQCPLPPDILPRSFCLSIKDVLDSTLGSGQKVETFNVIGQIKKIHTVNATYACCPHPDCNKSIERGKCEIPDHKPSKKKRYCYRLHIGIADGPHRLSLVIFSPLADAMVGEEAEEMHKHQDEDSYLEDKLRPLMRTKWWFTVQARTNRWWDKFNSVAQSEIQYTVTAARKLDEEEDSPDNDKVSEVSEEVEQDLPPVLPDSDDEDDAAGDPGHKDGERSPSAEGSGEPSSAGVEQKMSSEDEDMSSGNEQPRHGKGKGKATEVLERAESPLTPLQEDDSSTSDGGASSILINALLQEYKRKSKRNRKNKKKD